MKSVHNLEHGGVVIHYGPQVPPAEVQKNLARSHMTTIRTGTSWILAALERRQDPC